MREYLYLSGAILAEIVGTTSLKFADGFTNPGPTAVVVVAYLCSFYFLSLTLQQLPIGLVYATWSVVGIVGTVAVGVVAFDESVDLAGVVGLALVVGGVLVLNLFSDAYSPAA